ncbi:mannonate dehydratase [Shimia sp.]|uniref:mannonate dehydratase n=1 Tax=Shimia sp. TaxID=1954381 RepID=UPI003296D1D1
MKPVWRWFGPNDPITLTQIRQAGADGIVTALHDCAPGQDWPRQEIARINEMIEDHGLTWDVCESIWMPDAIKLQGSAAKPEMQAWISTMQALAEAGVKTICYNFMPLLDWTRTDLAYPIDGRGQALRFDMIDFVIFDVHILMRPNAKADYSETLLSAAHERHVSMTEDDDEALQRNIIAGLPGSAMSFTTEQLLTEINKFSALSHNDLRANLTSFLKEVAPKAEELGVHLAIHPDDPPRPLFGLPRCVSTADDLHAVLKAHPSPANGLTFCTGSLGARLDNDLPAMAREFGDHVHFAHLRNVLCEPDGSFHEAAVYEGSADMVAVIRELLNVSRNDARLPYRADHGHLLDFETTATVNPGYSYLGRLKGLAELQGAIKALSSE